jgi:hypothetical protein
MNKDIAAGLLLSIMGIGGIFSGMHFGHQSPAVLMLIPVGTMCCVMAGFLLAGGMREK